MAKKENQSPKLRLDDKEYDVNKDLNDEQKQIYLHLKNIEDKINSNIFIQQQLAVSKNVFESLMRESFERNKNK